MFSHWLQTDDNDNNGIFVTVTKRHRHHSVKASRSWGGDVSGGYTVPMGGD